MAPEESKYFSNLFLIPLNSLALVIGCFLLEMFGHNLEYFEFISTHFSRSGSVLDFIAPAGHSGSHTPQSIHSLEFITRKLFPS